MATDTILNFQLTAQDKASSVLQDTAKKLQTVSDSTTNVGSESKKSAPLFSGLIAQFAIGNIIANESMQVFNKVTSTLKGFFDEANAQQAIVAQLNNGLKSTSGASGMTIASLEKLASATEKSTLFSKLQVEQSESLLLTYTNIGQNVFPQAETAATNLAQRFGLDLTAASKLVGKALQDPTKGLSTLQRYIGQLSPAQKELIKNFQASGDTAGAQAVLLDALNVKMGGSASAATTTFGGKMHQLGNEIMTTGAAFTEHLLNALNDATAFYDKHQKAINNIIGVLGPLVGGILGVIVAIKLWEGAVKALELAQAALNIIMDMNPITLAIMAIAGLALLVVTHWKVVKQWFMDFVHDVGGFFSMLWDGISKGLKAVVGFISAPFKAEFNFIAKMWNETIGKLSIKIPSWVPVIGGKGFDFPQIPQFANGVSNFQGGLAIVGERGPELVSLPGGSSVTPAGQTAAMLSNSNQTINMTFAPNMGVYAGLPSEKRAIAVELYTEVVREARSHGINLPTTGSVSIQ